MVQCHTPYTGEALGKRERPPFPVGKGALLDGALFAGGFYRGVLGDGEGNGILQHGIGGQQLGHDDIAVVIGIVQLGIIRQTVGAGGEGEDLIVAGHFHIIIVEGKILGLFDEAIEGGIGGVGVDVVELDIGVEYRKYLPDHVLFDGGVVDIRMGLGKFLVLILQQLGELGAVGVVLIIGQQGIFGPA